MTNHHPDAVQFERCIRGGMIDHQSFKTKEWPIDGQLGTEMSTRSTIALVLVVAAWNSAVGQEVPSVNAVQFRQTVDAGVQYLVEKGQEEDGSFSKSLGPAVTAMCTTALVRNGVSADHPAVKKGLKYVEGFVQPDGGVYAKGSNLRNYETSVAVMLFTEVNQDGRYDVAIDKAIGFLKGIQWDDGEGHTRTDAFYGGQDTEVTAARICRTPHFSWMR